MNEWITDRLPTEGETSNPNIKGNVRIPKKSKNCNWHPKQASHIKLGEPWAPWPKMPPFEPKEIPWDRPSDFPPVCWLWRPHWEGCALVTKLYPKNNRIYCSGFDVFTFKDLKNCRWSDHPFDKFSDGNPCTKKS